MKSFSLNYALTQRFSKVILRYMEALGVSYHLPRGGKLQKVGTLRIGRQTDFLKRLFLSHLLHKSPLFSPAQTRYISSKCILLFQWLNCSKIVIKLKKIKINSRNKIHFDPDCGHTTMAISQCLSQSVGNT